MIPGKPEVACCWHRMGPQLRCPWSVAGACENPAEELLPQTLHALEFILCFQIQKQEEGLALCQVGDHVFTKCVALSKAVPMPGIQLIHKPVLGQSS